jgi:glycosyltransferase involved in cell wall biosynthesis
MSRVLVVSGDVVGPQMSGPGIRAWELSRQLARHNRVRLAAPGATPALNVENPALVRYEPDGAALKEQIPWAQVLVVQAWSTLAFPFLVEPAKVLVFDLYNPSFLENLVAHADDAAGDRAYHLQAGMDLVRDLLAIGDLIICANERQRDFWLGWLAALGRINHPGYERDPSFRALIDVVPFGVPDEPPRHTAQVLKGVHPGIGPEDRLVLWNGGMWQWLDPALCVEAARRLADRPDVKLFFLSAGEISASRPRMFAARRARELADGYGLTGRQVFFNDTWVAYDQRQNYLLEADLGLLAHRPHIETWFSNRTRLLDCVWAGLPVVTTRGDVLSDWVERYELGRCVAHDADEMAQAILDVLATPRQAYRPRFAQLSDRLAWSRAAEPLLRFCARPAQAPDRDAALAARWQAQRAASAARRERELLDAYRKLEQLRQHLQAIQQGRVMRLLNRLDRWLGRRPKTAGQKE